MIVKMTHPKSKLTISVLESQVKNAEYYGWQRLDDNSEKSEKPKTRVKQNGESSRK